MKSTWRIWAVTTLWLVVGTFGASAAEREHGPHVHGVGQLNVAAEGNLVEIELIAPGADIVGFEHRAENDADKAAVAAAEATLKAGDGLFAFPREAGCHLADADIESEMVEEDDDDEGDHAHNAGKDAHQHETHAAFHARYRYRCDSLDRVDHIDVKLFERFTSLHALHVQLISPRGQGSQELTPESARLRF